MAPLRLASIIAAGLALSLAPSLSLALEAHADAPVHVGPAAAEAEHGLLRLRSTGSPTADADADQIDEPGTSEQVSQNAKLSRPNSPRQFVMFGTSLTAMC